MKTLLFFNDTEITDPVLDHQSIDHFTVVAKLPGLRMEAAGDPVLIQTFILL